MIAYVTPPPQSLYDQAAPIKELFGFERVRLDPGHTTQVFFPLDAQALLTVARAGSKWLELGSYKILTGKQHMFTIRLREKPARWS